MKFLCYIYSEIEFIIKEWLTHRPARAGPTSSDGSNNDDEEENGDEAILTGDTLYIYSIYFK